MVTGDLPSISNYTSASTTYVPDTIFTGIANSGSGGSGGIGAVNNAIFVERRPLTFAQPDRHRQENEIKEPVNKMANPSRRIVKVIIIDPDDRVPLDKCILYSGEEKLTDLTDQELFFEVEIKSLLDKHNTYRKTVVDKTVKERTENLDAIKIRDLRMVVVDVAKF